MGREARVAPLSRSNVYDAVDNHAALIEALRDELLALRDRVAALETATDQATTYLEGRLDDQRLSGQTEPLKRNLRGRLRWLLTGR